MNEEKQIITANPVSYLTGLASGSETTRTVTLSPPNNSRYNRLVGILVFAPDTTTLNDATCGVVHDGVELFPSTYPAKLLQAGDAVPPNQKLYQLPFYRHGQGDLKVTVTHASAPSSYTLSVVGVYSTEEITPEKEWQSVESLYTY